IQLGSLPNALSESDTDLLRKFSPPLPHAAYNLEPDNTHTSAVRYLPLVSGAGEWHLLAFFNWSRFSESSEHFRLDQIGLDAATPYTLYEFFPAKYHGLIEGGSSLSIPPCSARLFGLRPYKEHPLLLASNRHISQGALDHKHIEWDIAEKKLSGLFKADPVHYELRFFVPHPWKYTDAIVSVKNYEVINEGSDVILLRFSVENPQSVTWSITFK
ncbi:MAG: hypothetical protein KAH38_09815, partial [Candidatus Hydrogenedentes bacterium]|nr:hypothetical protein [Candidatus Hydrogenedentota bacterium]